MLLVKIIFREAGIFFYTELYSVNSQESYQSLMEDIDGIFF